MATMADAWPSLLKIERSTQVVDPTSHEASYTWAQLGSYAGIGCTVSATGGREVKASLRSVMGGASSGTFAEALVVISVAAVLPLAKASDRAVVIGEGAGTYDILSIQSSSRGMMSRITAKVVVTD